MDSATTLQFEYVAERSCADIEGKQEMIIINPQLLGAFNIAKSKDLDIL